MLENCLKLVNCALIPVIISSILFFIDRKTKFNKVNNALKQIIIGIIFGICAIISTQHGASFQGVIMNVRDTSPIIAALLFGAPAGIIAGLIGGIWRWIAIYFGAGTYTRIACSVSTIVAGIFAAWLKKNIFEKKIPSWFYGLAIGIVAEVFHMLMIFLTNMSDVHTAFTFVENCAIPMIVINSLAIMAAMIIANWIEKKPKEPKKEKGPKRLLITNIFQTNLFVLVLFAYLLTSTFTFFIQYKITENDSEKILALSIDDVKSEVKKMSDDNILNLAYKVKKVYESTKASTVDDLKKIADDFEIAEIDIIGDDGIIDLCTDASFIGYDMASEEQSREFLVLLDGSTEDFVQEFGNIGVDKSISRKYAGVTLANGGFLQVAYDAEELQNDIANNIDGITRNRRVRESGFVIVFNNKYENISAPEDKMNINLSDISVDVTAEENQEVKFETNVLGVNYLCICDDVEGYYVVAMLPTDEAVFSRDIAIYVNTFMEILVFAGLFILVYFLLKKSVVDNFYSVNDSLSKITKGNLNEKVSVYANSEFSDLSSGINETVDALKDHIEAEKKRLDDELKLAKSIQHSALPSVFPPYPNRKDFDIWASMDTAKEVGGDFYDIYMLDDNKIAFMIADVSGKGIPAAMFMMQSKTILKSLAETGIDIAEVFNDANQGLCANNEAGMFVTAWMGIVDLNTGVLTFINAGHNPPLIRKNGGNYEFVKERSGMFLATFENAKYKKYEIKLEKGDEVFLYTDGVTESINANKEMYGEGRLQNILNSMHDVPADEVCKKIKNDVFRFANGEDQFDDITMLYFRYNGKKRY